MVGMIIIGLGLLSSVVSSVFYFRAASGDTKAVVLARRSFWVSTASAAGSFFFLLFLILGHRFEFSYVWNFSSRELPGYLLVSAMWAGQEGSFLLWCFFTAMMGIVLLAYARRRKIEFEAMSVFAGVQIFLFALLVVKSPFTLLSNSLAGQPGPGVVPNDGKGLNPLLQNIWMVIHPPFLFLGFASMSIPFVLATASLWKRAFDRWVELSIPWVLFSCLALGMGLILGGYWAYGVLGWGGWWGWDPVENSSLIPWLASVILLHTLIIQKKINQLARTNFGLAIGSFALVVYSSFLTRSGVLGSASVHSFVDPGAAAYVLLLVWLAGVIVTGLLLLKLRWRELPAPPRDPGLLNRESFMGLGALVMALCAVVILIGTSLPLFSASSMEPAFYNDSNGPLSVVLLVLLGVSLLLGWKENPRVQFLRSIWLPFVGCLVAAELCYYFGVRDFLSLLIDASAAFVLIINVIRLFRMTRETLRLVGGTIAHLGVACLFFGIVQSGHYGTKQTATLVEGQSQDVQGYQMTLLESRQGNEGKEVYRIQIQKQSNAFILEPSIAPDATGEKTLRTPAFASFLSHDVYLEPVSYERSLASEAHDMLRLEKGVPAKIGEMTVEFVRFDMPAHGANMDAGTNGLRVGAVLEVTRGGKAEQVVPAAIYTPGKSPESPTARLQDGMAEFKLLGMNIDMKSGKSTIDLLVMGLGSGTNQVAHGGNLVVEASIKPFIAFVWLGSALTLLGLTVALVSKNRRQTMNEGKG